MPCGIDVIAFIPEDKRDEWYIVDMTQIRNILYIHDIDVIYLTIRNGDIPIINSIFYSIINICATFILNLGNALLPSCNAN